MVRDNRAEENHAFSDLEEKLFSLLDQMRTNEIRQADKDGRGYHVHGLCAVLGYNPEEHASYFSFEAGKDLFQNQEIYLQDPEALQALEKAMEIDGAILIDKDGKLTHSGRYMLPDLRGVYSTNEKALATYKKIQKTSDAGTRHFNAVALSAERPDLLFYTLKSDYPELRIFRGGDIVRSTVPGEVKHRTPAYQEDKKSLDRAY